MPELTTMVNIGGEMGKKLLSVEIDTPEALAELGAKQAFFRLKAVYPRVCLVHLYTLEGAIRGVEFHALPDGVKEELKAFCYGSKAGG